MSVKRSLDKPFLAIVLALVTIGLFVFSSASLGLLARDTVSLTSITIKQIGIGIVGGILGLGLFSRIPYKKWREYATPLFVATLLLTGLVFVPGIGFATGGAHRWLALGPIMFQPSEALKLTFVIFLAALFTKQETDMTDFKKGMLPFLVALGTVGILLLKQPDTGTFMIFCATGFSLYFVAGGSLKQLSVVAVAGILAIGVLASYRPYLKERLLTFVDPSRDSLGSSYQIQQALIAIGSGKTFGRGFGQSVQKFSYLPEPIGDSIFAVAAEEFGLVGCVVLIGLFFLFTLRGLKIAVNAPDSFSSLLVVGIIVHIVSQSVINISAMLGLIPLTGVPLMFVSHGGTALLIGLCEIGIVLHVSSLPKRRIFEPATA